MKKTAQAKSIRIRLEADLLQRLQRSARENHRSVTAEISYRLGQMLPEGPRFYVYTPDESPRPGYDWEEYHRLVEAMDKLTSLSHRG